MQLHIERFLSWRYNKPNDIINKDNHKIIGVIFQQSRKVTQHRNSMFFPSSRENFETGQDSRAGGSAFSVYYRGNKVVDNLGRICWRRESSEMERWPHFRYTFLRQKVNNDHMIYIGQT